MVQTIITRCHYYLIPSLAVYNCNPSVLTVTMIFFVCKCTVHHGLGWWIMRDSQLDHAVTNLFHDRDNNNTQVILRKKRSGYYFTERLLHVHDPLMHSRVY